MLAWADFASAAPELASRAGERLHGRISYLATVKPDGAPRVHPVTPILAPGALYVFMDRTSPKGRDLERDPRFALHAGVEDNEGGAGEVMVTGRATRTADARDRAAATQAASYAPAESYILFSLEIATVMFTTYDGDRPVRTRWPG